LKDGQLEELEAKLNDEDFKQEYENQLDISLALEAKEDQTQKDFLKKRERKHPLPKTRPIWQIILLGIASIAMLSWGIFHYLSPKKDAAEKIFSANFSPYTNITMPSVRSEGNISPLEKAFLLYDQRKYEEAEAAFETNSVDSLASSIIFYTAISELAQGKTNESLAHFKQFEKADAFYPHSLWYRALIKIKEEEDGAKALLEEMLNFEKPPFEKKAKALLERL